ncbi:MAG: hypothetical protein K6T90_20745, partial [Leptolyngbyaceae cyanobacterium HOT.MB2.61]|nr:hypothetical protein [Leptolyngbyaceae cyanobacterium HOT.MB2.61]
SAPSGKFRWVADPQNLTQSTSWVFANHQIQFDRVLDTERKAESDKNFLNYSDLNFKFAGSFSLGYSGVLPAGGMRYSAPI